MYESVDDMEDALRMLRSAFSRVGMPPICSESYGISRSDIEYLFVTDARNITGDQANNYLSEVNLTVGSNAELKYLLPKMLEVYAKNGRLHEGLRESLWSALSRQQFVERELTDTQRRIVFKFLRVVALSQLRQTELTGYCVNSATWTIGIEYLVIYGASCPDICKVWTRWWDDHVDGSLCSAVAYIACASCDLYLWDAIQILDMPLEYALFRVSNIAEFDVPCYSDGANLQFWRSAFQRTIFEEFVTKNATQLERLLSKNKVALLLSSLANSQSLIERRKQWIEERLLGNTSLGPECVLF